MSTTCIIQLDNFQGQYYPGNTIVGKVICSFSKPINTRGIRVNLEGKEHTQWTQTTTYYDKDLLQTVTKLIPVMGNNNVLDTVTTLAGEGNYAAGRHEYPFTFVLPKNLPATYQGKHGSIKYNIKGTVVVPFGFDHQDIKEFKVVAPIDFNETPGLQMNPITYSVEKNVWWLFRTCGLISMKLHLKKTAFVQGEVVKARLEVSNMSTENIRRIEVKMGMTIESSSTFPAKESKTDDEVLTVASDTGVGAHGGRTYLFDLIVPESTVVPNFSNCKLFRQSAKIDVTAVLKGFHSNLELSAPIQLGNIPARRVEHFPQNSQSVPPSAPPQASAPPYSPGGDPYSLHSTNVSQPPFVSREMPPPYSRVDTSVPCRDSAPSRIYPEVPSYVADSGPYLATPMPSVPTKGSPEECIGPLAPKDDIELDGEFVLV